MNASSAIAGAIAFVVVVLLLPVVIRLCERWRLFDAPGPLKIHSRPIPRLGGIAVALAVAAAAFVASPRLAAREWPFFAALALIWATGLADDLLGLSPVLRLAAQIAAGLLLWRGGLHLPALGDGYLDLTAVSLIVVVFANAWNFADGSDGLAAGVTCIVALAVLSLPAGSATPFSHVLACSLAGACAAFLFANFPPAKLFLGDSGSNAVGFCVAFLALTFYRSAPTTPSRILFPVAVAALPLLDAALAVLRRLLNGRSPLQGDRRHLYDLLMARGWSARRVAVTSYGVSALFASLAWVGLRSESPKFWLIPALSLVALIVAALRLGSLRVETRGSAVERLRA